jgi:hypothetical protein
VPAIAWAQSAENAGGATRGADVDADGIPDSADNCPTTINAGQENADGDSEGDACDLDDDNDATPDDTDNCPLAANPGQENVDGDSLGDTCDDDDDNDTVLDGPDRCDTVAGNTVSGCPAAQRTLTIRHILNRAEISGRLIAPGFPPCRQRQRVTLFRVLPGPDVNLGTTTTLDSGRYKFEGATSGPYYTTVKRKLIPNVADCAAATSPNAGG